MTNKEYKISISDIKEIKKELLSDTDKARDFLVKVGTHTKAGKLRKPYK